LPDNSKRLYEAMFLVDSADASADWDGVVSTIGTLMDRARAEVISTRKWDDRRLCFEIDGRRRGTYVLSYFNAEPDTLSGLERDVKLNDRILRVLILRGDHLNEDRMNAATPLMKMEEARSSAAEDTETAVAVTVSDSVGDSSEKDSTISDVEVRED